ncbi:hypothetical protein HAX54_021279, partial [Datura stramonium]|nr:hypothetical protein [Datura stramonium]
TSSEVGVNSTSPKQNTILESSQNSVIDLIISGHASISMIEGRYSISREKEEGEEALPTLTLFERTSGTSSLRAIIDCGQDGRDTMRRGRDMGMNDYEEGEDELGRGMGGSTVRCRIWEETLEGEKRDGEVMGLGGKLGKISFW